MDIYLPANRNKGTKVIILLHGGGWSGGSKVQLNYLIPIVQAEFPQHAIVNMDYRLASFDSPAFPKQLEDIEKAIAFIQDSDYNIGTEYAFIGLSAGAHLAMLHSYKNNGNHTINAVCSIVGPTDFTDPFYVRHPYYHYAAMYLLGNSKNDNEAILGISPTNYINPKSPATLLFYGGKDPVVPQSQATRLKAKLDENGVYNEYYLYKDGGHSNWNAKAMDTFRQKLVAFLKNRF